MRRSIRGICIALLALTFRQFLIADDDDVGSVCIAPIEKPTNGVKSLANPTGGNRVLSYAIQLDRRPAVGASAEHGIAINDLPLADKHLVRVKGDGKNIAVFRFRFVDYSSHDLCLWFNPLYETWSLTPAKGHGKGCICH